MAEQDPRGVEAAPAIDPLLVRARFDMNDLGNARRFAQLARRRLLYVEELKAWVAFDHQRWSAREGGAIALALAQAVAEDLKAEVAALYNAKSDELSGVFGPKFDDDMRKERAGHLFGWAMKTGNSDRANGMMKQAQGLRDEAGQFVMRAGLDAFDTDPLAYHCRNGAVRYVKRDGAWDFRFDDGHDPADMFMQMADVDFDLEAAAPLWRARLEQLHDDPVQRTALARIYGMTTTALISDQSFYVFQGKGNDGKSMSNSVIGAIHGDYFRSSSPQTFLQTSAKRNASDHQSDIVRLAGDIRLVVCDEPPKNSTWNGERIKQVTGSKITARAPNAREEISFAPHWNLIVECNNLPKAPSDDRGFRRRFKLYVWAKTYGVTPGLDDRPFDEVEAELLAERSGILNWMIAGAIEWLNMREIPEPAMSTRAKDSFWSGASAMGDWLADCADLSEPDASTGATTLYNAFKDYCLARGDKEDSIISQTRFGSALNDAQIYRAKDARGNVVRIGIKLRSPAALWGTGASQGVADVAPPVSGVEDYDFGGGAGGLDDGF